jgi:integrase
VRKLFNENIKNEFIEEYTRSRIVSITSLNAIFRKVTLFERNADKDISLFDEQSILEMYKSFDMKSVNTLQNYNNYLKSYCSFVAYKTGLSHNAFTNITKDMLKRCISETTRKNKYLTYDQLQDLENELLNYTEAAILECLWAGIAGKELADLTYLKRSQINMKNMTITFGDQRVYKIYDRLYYLLDKAFNETEYVCYGETMKVKPVVGHDCLYKVRDNAYKDGNDVRFRWVYRKIIIIRDYFDIPELSMKTIHGAGLLHKIKCGMAHENVGFKDFLLSEQGDALMKQYGFSNKNRVDVVFDKFVDYI